MRTYKRKTVEFVAWDGEGAQINGEPQYILLRNSYGRSIRKKEGLSTEECLKFILSESLQGSNGKLFIHVIYGGSYDVNMLLRDLSRQDIWKLWQYGWCEWNGYKIEYTHRKSFTVSSRRIKCNNFSNTRRCSSNNTNENRASKTSNKRSINISITLWDVFGFFQSTFVDAMQKYLPDYDKEKLQNIIEHKKQRADFRAEDLDDIDEYCKLEIDALVEIMNNVKKAMDTADIHVSRWDGAGAVAAALLKKYRVKEHQRDFSKENPEIHKEAWRAYAGGRIECLQYGFTSDKIWHGDINSAYPSACLLLPSFSNGYWKRVNNYHVGVFGLYKLAFNFTAYPDAPFYPFFYRDVDGRITYPIYGCGTYWQPEVEQALKHMPNGVKIIEGWIWTPFIHSNHGKMESMCYPFIFVKEIYQQRLEYKKQKNAAQMILKLGMNSLYGKLAQQIGYKKNEKPSFQQVEWAGFITSKTRAVLFDVAMQQPDNVVMFATDGLFSTAVHQVKEGKGLGEWEVHEHDRMVVAQSGVYWYYDNDTKTWTDKFRGFDREELTWEKVYDSFQKLKWHLTVPSKRFLTMGGALVSLNQWKKWRTWPENSRRLSLIACGTKRTDVSPFWTCSDNPSMRLFQTLPLINETALLGVPSQLYKKTEKILNAKRLEQEEQDGFV